MTQYLLCTSHKSHFDILESELIDPKLVRMFNYVKKDEEYTLDYDGYEITLKNFRYSRSSIEHCDSTFDIYIDQDIDEDKQEEIIKNIEDSINQFCIIMRLDFYKSILHAIFDAQVPDEP